MQHVGALERRGVVLRPGLPDDQRPCPRWGDAIEGRMTFPVRRRRGGPRGWRSVLRAARSHSGAHRAGVDETDGRAPRATGGIATAAVRACLRGSCESRIVVERSAVWMARAVRDREISALELFDAHAARIAERDPLVNALVLPRLGAAREEALVADAALARGEAVGPLHGVPFTAKDPIPVAGMRAPNGSRLLADHVSEVDAEVIRRLRGAGAILLGKTNVSEFAMR